MKNLIKIICVALIVISCNTNPTIQHYFVENKDNNDFISLDISSDILKLKTDSKESDELNDILNSIKKINVLILTEKDGNKSSYQIENKKVKEILKNSDYKPLFKANHKSGNISVQYIGKEDAINEVVVFASGKKEKSFALFRLLGDHINPEKIMTLLQNTKIDRDSEDVDKAIQFFENLF